MSVRVCLRVCMRVRVFVRVQVYASVRACAYACLLMQVLFILINHKHLLLWISFVFHLE